MKAEQPEGDLLEYHKVDSLEVETRLSDYDFQNFKTIPSRKQLKISIKRGLIFIDGKLGYTGDRLRGGELIEVYSFEDRKNIPVLELALEVVYEDEVMALVHKPAGIEVSGNKFRTLEHSLPFNLKQSISDDSLTKPQAIHRLDYATSGIVLIGKTRSSVISLNRAFELRNVEKEYLAVVHGTCDARFESKLNIDGKETMTSFELISKIPSESFGALSLLKCFPLTGRRHQIRIHLADLGHQILGDKLYREDDKVLKGKGMFLHALALSFPHPTTGEVKRFSTVAPSKFKKLFPSIS